MVASHKKLLLPLFLRLARWPVQVKLFQKRLGFTTGAWATSFHCFKGTGKRKHTKNFQEE
jgi:hypothetical protein